MEIAHRDQFVFPGAPPFLACIGLALRTMSISAGVVRDGLVAAANALIAMPAQRGGAAALCGPEFRRFLQTGGVEPFAWFNDVLSRIPAHSIARLTELLPHNWRPATSSAEA